MEVVKSTAEYTVYKKRNNRYAVKNADKKYLNGEDKIKILLQEGLIKLAEAKAKAEEPTEEATEAAAEGDAAAPAEESPAE
jgi:hypothetical protein